MIINLKYYVITIVAIFLALAIGLFIGIMLDGQDIIVEQQQQIVNQLESKFDEFKSKQDELQGRIDSLTVEKEKNIKFIDRVFPILIKDKLKNLNVVIIETSEDYAYSGISEAFKNAGVSGVSNILIKNTFLLNDENYAQQVAADLNLSGNTKEEIEKQLIKSLASSIVSNNNSQVLAYLKEKKMIDYSNDLPYPADYVIIGGGSVNEDRILFNEVETPLVHQFKNSNIPVIAVEKLDVAYSNISEYKKLRISTIDNVDTTIGKISMVMVASGKEGHYGEKKTAEALIPEGFILVD